MAQTNTSNKIQTTLSSSAIELVKWPLLSSNSLDEQVLAFQTTRIFPQLPLNSQLYEQSTLDLDSALEIEQNDKSAFDAFNLGLHVGDSIEQVNQNRRLLTRFLNQQVIKKSIRQQAVDKVFAQHVNIQWLEQVHGNKVVEVTCVDEQAMTADASITREKNIALAIMTADCLPILLSHKDGTEVAAIHGGWRPLAANIIEETLNKMHSEPADIVAWLGPCIGKSAFEVGSEVKEVFIQQGKAFSNCFAEQTDGKYLADLHKIAKLQLKALGVTDISALPECTYHQTNKYYSYRKESVTGRMASIICRR